LRPPADEEHDQRKLFPNQALMIEQARDDAPDGDVERRAARVRA
jgi:hypothetical protein